MAYDAADVSSRQANQRCTWEGCSVLLDINDGDRLVFARLSFGATLKIGNKKCSLRPLIGCPFGSMFRVETSSSGSHLARCVSSSTCSTLVGNVATVQNKDYLRACGEIKDNRSLFDNNTAQGLSSEDIDLLKREGATGDEIVEALISNSSTFDKKTAFSQEKYKLKKQKKYAPKVLLRRPFSRSICEAYFKKYPTRIGSLRFDALCLLLSMANVGAYSDVLVLDMVSGLLTGAVAERLGGTGYVCSMHFGTSCNPIDIVRMFNFSTEVNTRIVQASFSDLSLVQETDCNPFQQDISKTENDNKSISFSAVSELQKNNVLEDEVFQEVNISNDKSCSSLEISEKMESVQSFQQIQLHSLIKDSEEGFSVPPTPEKLTTPGKQASSELIKSWKEKGFSSLIVAAPELDVESLVLKLLPLLSYSAPFAIYSHCLQPLAMCMHKLQASKMAISLQISEPWLREYQVLPSRTHPHMQMSAFGGYILSGIRISSDGCNGSNET